MKWYIQNHEGKYVRVSGDEAGTILLYHYNRLATVFGPCTRDYVDGICKGMEIGLGGKFTPVQVTHDQKSSYEKVDDIHAGK